MKKSIKLMTSFVFFSLLIGCTSESADESQGTEKTANGEELTVQEPNVESAEGSTAASVEELYTDITQLASDSDLIAVAEFSGGSEEVTYKAASFKLRELEVTDVVAGDEEMENQTVTLIGYVPAKGKYLLFLGNHNTIVEDAYIIKGVYQGVFQITNGGNLEYLKEEGTFQQTFAEENSLTEAISKIEEAL